MSSSSGHAIYRLGGEGMRAFVHTTVTREPPLISYDGKTQVLPERWVPGCTGPRCDEKPVFVTRYFYVTGRAGRVTDRIQYRCQAHGEAFAKKHGLEVPQ